MLQSLCAIKVQKPNHPPDVITLDQVNRKSIEIEVETYLKLPLSIICSTWKFMFKQFFFCESCLCLCFQMILESLYIMN